MAYQKLFAAIDFSPGSDAALKAAHDRAVSTAAKLAVCHVVPNELRSNVLFPHIGRIAALKVPLDVKDIAEAAAARVSEVTGRAQGEYELIVDDGTPQAFIVERAEEWGADLIVLGSHGQTSPAGAHLGSVSHSVIRHAHCAVLVVRPGEHGDAVVAGTDFSDPAFPALRAAADEAKRTGAELIVVHCLDFLWSPAAYPAMAFGGAPFNVPAEHIRELEAIATERLEESLRVLGEKGETVVTAGPAGAALGDVAAERGAGLLVVGTLGRTGLRRALLGSVAETVARDAPCSVLVVRRHPG
jgi:nucleotide-binding universal stress UspA family protein